MVGLLAWAGVSGISAQDGQEKPEAPEAKVELIGDVYQQLTEIGTSWSSPSAYSWLFATDLRPKVSYGPVSFLADTTVDLPESGTLIPAEPSILVYEAYFRVTPFHAFDLTFGQKHYNIGVGQTFTVGDSINPVVGFFDQKTGFRGATAEWSPASWVSVSGAVSTDGNNPASPVEAQQVSLLLDKLQLTGSLVAGQNQTFNPGVGVSYDLATVILTAEGAAEFLPQGLRPQSDPMWNAPAAWSSPALSGSAGARWTVTISDVDYTISGEYLHWGQGFTSSEVSVWESQASTLRAQMAARATRGIRDQENAFFRFSAVSGTEYSLTAFAAVDLQDASVLTQQSATWTPWDNLDFNLTLMSAWGGNQTAWQYIPANPVQFTPQSQYQVSFATTYHF
jgi:hypothetical protein